MVMIFIDHRTYVWHWSLSLDSFDASIGAVGYGLWCDCTGRTDEDFAATQTFHNGESQQSLGTYVAYKGPCQGGYVLPHAPPAALR